MDDTAKAAGLGVLQIQVLFACTGISETMLVVWNQM